MPAQSSKCIQPSRSKPYIQAETQSQNGDQSHDLWLLVCPALGWLFDYGEQPAAAKFVDDVHEVHLVLKFDRRMNQEGCFSFIF